MRHIIIEGVLFSAPRRIPAPNNEPPLLTMPILYRRPGGTINNHEKPQRSVLKEHVGAKNLQHRIKNDEARALTLGSAGNVDVTGKSYRNATGYDYATVKYRKKGT